MPTVNEALFKRQFLPGGETDEQQQAKHLVVRLLCVWFCRTIKPAFCVFYTT